MIRTLAAVTAAVWLSGAPAHGQTPVVDATAEPTPAWCAANAASMSSALFDNSDNDNKAMIDMIMARTGNEDEISRLRHLSGWAYDDAETLDDRYPDSTYDPAAKAAFAAMDHQALASRADACLP